MRKPILLIGTSALHRREMVVKHMSADYDVVSLSPDINEKSVRGRTASALTHNVADAKMDAILAAVRADALLSSRLKSCPGSVAVTFDQVVVFDDTECDAEEGATPVTAHSMRDTGCSTQDSEQSMDADHATDCTPLVEEHDRIIRKVLSMKSIREKPVSPEEALSFITCYANRSVYTVQCTVLYRFDTQTRCHAVNTTATRYGAGLTVDVAARVLSRGTCMHTAGALVVEDVDMQACMKEIYIGTEEEVRGFSARTLQSLLCRD